MKNYSGDMSFPQPRFKCSFVATLNNRRCPTHSWHGPEWSVAPLQITATPVWPFVFSRRPRLGWCRGAFLTADDPLFFFLMRFFFFPPPPLCLASRRHQGIILGRSHEPWTGRSVDTDRTAAQRQSRTKRWNHWGDKQQAGGTSYSHKLGYRKKCKYQ